ncbi:DUF2484 family protein [Loktanella sp. SALINAS62]|uniref:DUF2484 family protein n=1 Tax=Loktanella sp. SALINAS62 TaxID=2706124 RepID=UPI001B8D9EFB|nr:DUF2484 family protein [Loktanella sp. SALINAS62]MBS1303816.1 DUF2484 family protein [Loktanella sp. SALINAS62]
MTPSLIIAALWVIAATVTAFLPMRHQYVPGVALLLVAPVLIVWLGVDLGWLVAGLAVLAFVSMFRNPLRYLFARARGQTPEVPR